MDTLHRQILRLALPSIITNITVPLLGIADLAIVGHIGNARHLGAIAVGTMVFNVLYWVFAFLRMGTSGMTAQAYGQQNRKEMADRLLHSSSLALALGFVFVLLQQPLCRLALWLIAPSAEVAPLVCVYFNICIWGAPAVLSLYALTGWFIGMQDTRIPMRISILQNVLNIAASAALVFLLGMGIEGVATGTLVAQWAGTGIALYHLPAVARREQLSFSGKQMLTDGMKRAVAIWRKLCGQRRDAGTAYAATTARTAGSGKVFSALFFRSLCLVAVNLYFTSAGARQSDLILAANTLLMTFFTLFSYIMDGFAFAGEALCGRFYGAADKETFRQVCHRLFAWGALMGVLFTLAYLLGGKLFVGLLTNDTAVIDTSYQYAAWTAAIPFCALAAFLYDGIFIGMTDTASMFASTALAALVFFLLETALFPAMGNHALWLSLQVFLVCRGAVLHWKFRKSSWGKRC